MNPKDETKRVLGNIKHEDCKFSVTTDESSASIATDANTIDLTIDLTIKEENTEDYKPSLEQQREFDERGYYYRCDICNKRKPNLKSVLDHRKSIHHIKRMNFTKVNDINMEPDINDPNFHCSPCGKGFQDVRKYRQHLRQVHYMALAPMIRRKIIQNGVIPDLDDPNLHCKSCNLTYKNELRYKYHCQYAHGLVSVESTNRNSTPSNMPDCYCQVCDMRLSSVKSYQQHLFSIHKVDSRPKQRWRNDIVPNANDPNFYCHSCEKKMGSKRSFQYHLLQLHSISTTKPRKKSNLEPDVDDPNHYCRACTKTFVSKEKYRHHLRIVHRMKLPLLVGNYKREDFPDPYNPDYHCSVCKKSYLSSKVYRDHCKRIHFMELLHPSIVNPDAKIDINSPEYYCAQCEHSFAGKLVFRTHMGRVHNLVSYEIDNK